MTAERLPQCEFFTDKLIMRLELKLCADIEEIAPAIDRVMKVIGEMKCAERKEFEIETALREALANAVIHGARLNREKKIQLCVACDESRGILIIVRDPGSGFSPDSIPSPVIGQNIYSSHGRGIFLINQLMDEVRFERGGTEIHMRKH
jgi:serine/threonine-protein kinase RsbW